MAISILWIVAGESLTIGVAYPCCHRFTNQGPPRQHTNVFVAFAGEERGLVGSSRYVKNLTPEQKGLIRAFVNLDAFPLHVWRSKK